MRIHRWVLYDTERDGFICNEINRNVYPKDVKPVIVRLTDNPRLGAANIQSIVKLLECFHVYECGLDTRLSIDENLHNYQDFIIAYNPIDVLWMVPVDKGGMPHFNDGHGVIPDDND